jgi:glutamate-5-semialdehyde dehydrogenase
MDAPARSPLEAQMLSLGNAAREAARRVALADADARTQAIRAMARRLRAAAPLILAANAEDVENARAQRCGEPFIERLALDAAGLGLWLRAVKPSPRSPIRSAR